MISLSFHTSYALQPLDLACFKPFKSAFKGYRNKWMLKNSAAKLEKETLPYWINMALKKYFPFPTSRLVLEV